MSPTGSWARRNHASAPLRRLAALDRPNIFRSLSGDERPTSSTSRSTSPAHGSRSATTTNLAASDGAAASSFSPISTLHAEKTSSPPRQGSGTSSLSPASAEEHNTLVGTPDLVSEPASVGAEGKAKPERDQSHSLSTNYIHGFCFFRQKRDATIRRGYFQKSVVILSHLPYVSFFSEIVKRLGPLFFEKGMTILEAFCQDVQNWPPPEPGARMHLPLLGSVLSVELPYYSQPQASPLAELRLSAACAEGNKGSVRKAVRATDGSNEDIPVRIPASSEENACVANWDPAFLQILASIPNQPIFEVFREALNDMWLLWECLILAE